MGSYRDSLNKDLNIKIKPGSALYNMEKSLIDVLVVMHDRGLKVDEDRLKKELSLLSEELIYVSNELYTEAGEEFGISSRKDIPRIFKKLQIPDPPIKTKKGAISYSAESLVYIKEYKFVRNLMKARHLQSVIGASEDIYRNIKSGHVYPEFLPIGKDNTSRIYTTKPSVNQTPREIRKAIIPESGYKFWLLDWSGAEIYYLAKLAGQEDLTIAYESGIDIHRFVASRILGINFKDLSDELREVSKVITFSVVYGSEGDAAARAMKVTREQGVEWVQLFLKEFPKIKIYMDFLVEEARRTGCAITWLGRVRHLTKIRSNDLRVVREGERQAINTPIQSGVADLLKWGMIRIFNKHPDLKLSFVVFDSFLLQVPVSYEIEVLQSRLEQLFKFKKDNLVISFNFKLKEGYSWGDMMG